MNTKVYELLDRLRTLEETEAKIKQELKELLSQDLSGQNPPAQDSTVEYYKYDEYYIVEGRSASWYTQKTSEFISLERGSDQECYYVAMYEADNEHVGNFEADSPEECYALMFDFLEYNMYPGIDPHEAYQKDAERILRWLPIEGETFTPKLGYTVAKPRSPEDRSTEFCILSKLNPRAYERSVVKWVGQPFISGTAMVTFSEAYACPKTGEYVHSDFTMTVAEELADPLMRQYLAYGSVHLKCDGVDFPACG